MSQPEQQTGQSKSESTPSLVFEITTLSQRADLRPTGIDRIQLEIAMELGKHGPSQVAFRTFNSRQQRFDRVSNLTVQELGRRIRCATSQRGSARLQRSTGCGDLPTSIQPLSHASARPPLPEGHAPSTTRR